MEWILKEVREGGELGILVRIFVGLWVGKVGMGKFSLGRVRRVLLVGVVVGEVNIGVGGGVK